MAKAKKKEVKVKVSPELLKRYLKPLLKYRKRLEAIYVYGSAVTKRAGHDIDTMVIVNDTKKISEAVITRLEQECRKIEREGKEAGLNFHFQPIKLLSRWWHALIEGSPFIVSSLRYVWIIYDKKGLIKEVRGFIRKEKLYKGEEKSERLIEKSDRTALKNRQLLLNSISLLGDAATEAAQILLLFDNKLILNKPKIATELTKSYKKAIGEEVIGNYSEIVDLEKKAEKGALSEFTAENLDYYLEKIKRFIAKVEAMLSKR